MKLLKKLVRLLMRWLGRAKSKPRRRAPRSTPEPSIEPPEPQLKTLTVQHRPSRRSSTVQLLLDEAWDLGHRTYPDLIGYVFDRTGKSCSRSTIAAWKKKRDIVV
ncbi:MAG: hypothetical protein HC866_19575 [Leptolyngbyaceae cyanobacterium RU_5_1]|nr:hypothetical protein [Leptolyngbyaceae cyanobacterium RU_5_1]